MNRSLILSLFISALGTLGGCTHTHLGRNFGRNLRDTLAGQVVDPQAGAGDKPVQGLDPEEAAIVAANYRNSLSPAAKEEPARSVLVVTEDKPPKAAPALGESK